jgi:hypothetical protein
VNLRMMARSLPDDNVVQQEIKKSIERLQSLVIPSLNDGQPQKSFSEEAIAAKENEIKTLLSGREAQLKAMADYAAKDISALADMYPEAKLGRAQATLLKTEKDLDQFETWLREGRNVSDDEIRQTLNRLIYNLENEENNHKFITDPDQTTQQTLQKIREQKASLEAFADNVQGYRDFITTINWDDQSAFNALQHYYWGERLSDKDSEALRSTMRHFGWSAQETHDYFKKAGSVERMQETLKALRNYASLFPRSEDLGTVMKAMADDPELRHYVGPIVELTRYDVSAPLAVETIRQIKDKPYFDGLRVEAQIALNAYQNRVWMADAALSDIIANLQPFFEQAESLDAAIEFLRKIDTEFSYLDSDILTRVYELDKQTPYVKDWHGTYEALEKGYADRQPDHYQEQSPEDMAAEISRTFARRAINWLY